MGNNRIGMDIPLLNLIGKVKTLGFVEYPSPGSVRAADWLFVS